MKKPVWVDLFIDGRRGSALVHRNRVLARVWPVSNGNYWVGLFAQPATHCASSRLTAMRRARRELQRLYDLLRAAKL